MYYVGVASFLWFTDCDIKGDIVFMAKMYPSVVQDFHNSQGEKLVYEALSTLNNDYTVFYSYRWLGTSQQYRSEGEADFLVLHPRKGI